MRGERREARGCLRTSDNGVRRGFWGDVIEPMVTGQQAAADANIVVKPLSVVIGRRRLALALETGFGPIQQLAKLGGSKVVVR